MAELGGHLDLDPTLDQDQNMDRDTGDPQLDQAVRQWLSWDKVRGCWSSRHQTSRHFPTLFYKHVALSMGTAPNWFRL